MSDLMEILESPSKTSPKPSKLSKPALVILGVTGGIASAISLISIPFLSPAFRKICLPYVPASGAQLANVLSALRNRSGTLIDLGSGDGRIVRAAASFGFEAAGVELNLWLILYSRFLSLLKGRPKCCRFYRHNLWSFNLKPYSNVVIFGTEEMMPLIEKKFLKELEDDSVVVACRFPLPTLKPDKTFGEGIDTVWKYRIFAENRSQLLYSYS